MKQSQTLLRLLGTTLLLADGVPLSAPAAPAKPYGLTIKALQNSQKQTDVILEVTSMTDLTPPTSTKHTQLKSFDIDGKLRWTKNEHDTPLASGVKSSSTTFSYFDMEWQQKVQAQVQVQTVDTTKTEVLRAAAPVLFRPDLTVESINAPDKIRKGLRLNLGSVIHELKGDMGASAKVRLKEGDIVLDEVSVDVLAFGNVGAVFSINLNRTGTHNLTVEVGDVNPGDYDYANNTQTVTVEVLDVAEIPFSLSYNNYIEDSKMVWSYAWGSGSQAYKGTFEQFSETLYPQWIVFPLKTMRMDFTVDGGPGHTLASSDFMESTYSYGDADYYFEQTYSYKNLASDSWFSAANVKVIIGGAVYRFSTAQFYHWAGDYVYYSGGHDSFYNNSWSSSTTVKEGTFLDAKADIKTNFKVEDSEKTFGGNAEVTLAPFVFDYPFDYTTPDGFSRGYVRRSGVTGWTYGLTQMP